MRSEQKTQSKWFRHGAGFVLCAVAAVFALSLSGCDLFPSSASSFSGTKYAVVVGINDYINNNYVRDLHYCVNDATKINSMLSSESWTFPASSPIVAETDETTNKKATKDAIKAALEAVPANTTTFLFYFSGHGGAYSESEAYIVPSDYNGSTSTLISTTELSEWLADVDATNKIVILDSCYSGGFVDSGDSVDAAPGNAQQGLTSSAVDMAFRFGELLAQNSAAASSGVSTSPLVISAAGWDEFSYEGDYPPISTTIQDGYFTYYFTQAADTNSSGTMYGDSDGDGVLSCIEAYSYAKDKISQDSSSLNVRFLPHISGSLRDFALIDNR